MERSKLNEIIGLVSKEIGPAGYECIEAEWEGGKQILRLYVDQPDGINLDGCVAASRIISSIRELDEIVNGRYNLEVSSPGIERPIRSKAHFERHIGQVVQVKLQEKIFDRRHGVGKIVSISDKAEVTLETLQGMWSFPIERVQKASLVYSWKKK